MDVVMLGSGAADGWPNPFCGCDSCRGQRAAGVVRSQTSALLDDTVLLDCGPQAPAAAVRLGRSLAGVRHLLLTHDHPDHTAGAVLLWRAWAQVADGSPDWLDVVGPPDAVDACRMWVGPDDRVRFRSVLPGDEVTLGPADARWVARAVAAEHTVPTVLWDVTGPDGARLLYATDTGPLPAEAVRAVADARFDAVLLEETFGDAVGLPHGHLDLGTFAEQVQALREVGAVTPATRLVAVHLGHHNPPEPVLAERLAAIGAVAAVDGANLTVGPRAGAFGAPDGGGRADSEGQRVGAGAAAGRRVLVTGGARSGKSVHAEGLLAAASAVTYVATAPTRYDDPDWQDRVALHRVRRPAHWRTVEDTDLAEVLADLSPDDPPVLVDCLTLWLTAAMDDAGCWDERPGSAAALAAATDRLVDAWRGTRGHVVAVTNEVGDGVVPATASGRAFRDALGVLNLRVAAAADEVWHVVVGIPARLR